MPRQVGGGERSVEQFGTGSKRGLLFGGRNHLRLKRDSRACIIEHLCYNGCRRGKASGRNRSKGRVYGGEKMGRPASGKSRGAQKGNLNRLKHGFYSAQLRGLDVAGANRLESELSEEIGAYRAMLQRYLDQFMEAESEKEMGRILDLAGRAFTRIGNLVRIQKSFVEHHWDDSLEAVIARVLYDMDQPEKDADLSEGEDSEGL